MIYWIFGALILFGAFYVIVKKDKYKPYRTNYESIPPLVLKEDEYSIWEFVNEQREISTISLQLLGLDALACKVAEKYCKYMNEHGIDKHIDFRSRSRELVINNALAVGEVTSEGYRSPKGFVRGYMNHKDEDGNYTHRGTLLDPKYTHFGTSTIGKINVSIFVKYKK